VDLSFKASGKKIKPKKHHIIRLKNANLSPKKIYFHFANYGLLVSPERGNICL